jgi:hypothetical protein
MAYTTRDADTRDAGTRTAGCRARRTRDDPDSVTSTLNPCSIPVRHRLKVRGLGGGLVALAALAWLSLAATALSAAPAAPATSAGDPVSISSKHVYTPTGRVVRAGQSISVTASGRIHFGSPPIDAVDPAGIPTGECATIVGKQSQDQPFVAADLPCWSLIGKVGAGPPFEVGKEKTFPAPSTGPLFLGVNDNRLADNSGTWSATIVVGAAPVANGSKGHELLAALIALGLVVLAILIALAVVVARRAARRTRKAGASTDEPAASEPVLVAAVADPPLMSEDLLAEAIAPAAVAAAVAPNPDAPHEQTVAPLEGEFVDVNIFEVELSNGTDLRVGYNYFPEGADLHWQVRQGNIFAHGQFVTSGGGSLYHFVMLPLGVHLEPDPGSVDIEFTWTIGGVPFRYSVRRDPGY